MGKLKAFFHWTDRVVWGTPVGRALLLVALVSAGVPMMAAGGAADALNQAIDIVAGEG